MPAQTAERDVALIVGGWRGMLGIHKLNLWK
jgi:hypothetical protein